MLRCEVHMIGLYFMVRLFSAFTICEVKGLKLRGHDTGDDHCDPRPEGIPVKSASKAGEEEDSLGFPLYPSLHPPTAQTPTTSLHINPTASP